MMYISCKKVMGVKQIQYSSYKYHLFFNFGSPLRSLLHFCCDSTLPLGIILKLKGIHQVGNVLESNSQNESFENSSFKHQSCLQIVSKLNLVK